MGITSTWGFAPGGDARGTWPRLDLRLLRAFHLLRLQRTRAPQYETSFLLVHRSDVRLDHTGRAPAPACRDGAVKALNSTPGMRGRASATLDPSFFLSRKPATLASLWRTQLSPTSSSPTPRTIARAMLTAYRSA